MHIVVNTPSGNIGRRVAEEILANGHQLTVISRNPGKIEGLVAKGARLVVGSIDDAAVLTDAFEGADSLLWLTPFVFDQVDYVGWAERNAATAATIASRCGIRKAVLISSVGAQHSSGVGPIGCLPSIEASFRAACPEVVSLRAGSFMENFLMHVPSIARFGKIFGAYPKEMAIPLVATRDIADKAALALQRFDGNGYSVVGVHGPQDLTQAQATEIIALALDRPVEYVEISPDESRRRMVDFGMPEHAATLLAEMYAGFASGAMRSAEPRSKETTTPTSLLQFAAALLKPAVEAEVRLSQAA